MNALRCVALVAAGALAAGVAVAEDLPIKAPSTAVVTSSNQVYMWIDGTWLPISGAPVSSPSTPVADLTRGAIGYVFPDGTLAPVFGSNVRTEFGASSARADVPPFIGFAHGQTTVNGVTLGTCAVCPVQAASAYSGWQTSVKTTGDFKIQALTLSPSIALFSGRNHQDFAPVAPYASSALDWADVGAKLGLDAKVDLAKTLSFGLGGNLGVARRDTSLLANEVLATSGYATAPLLGNAEAKLMYEPLAGISVKTFAGVSHYDSRVPGLTATPTTPTGLPGVKFQPESGYYAGGSATVKFGQ